MPTTLPPIMTTTPLVDPSTGIPTRTGGAWLQASFLRQGGQEAATNTELAGGVVANHTYITQVESDLGGTNNSLASLEEEVTAVQEAVVHLAEDLDALTERVTTLETTIEAQETRIAALEAWKTAVQAALPAAVTVTAVPTLPAAPATATILRNDLTTTWQGPVNQNDSDLADTVNAVRNALAA